MRKHSIFFIVLLLISALSSFPQEIQRITYMDIGADGTQRIPRTVNAVFAGWTTQEIRQENNFRVVYMSARLVGGEWTDWELAERRPMHGTLAQQFDALLRDYTEIPNAGSIRQVHGGYSILQMMAIPTGSTRPIGWNTDGNSFWVFYRMYYIVP